MHRMLLMLFACLASVSAARAQTTFPADAGPLRPGDVTRSLKIADDVRTFIVHVPPGYKSTVAAPLVIALHGTAMNAPMMVFFCGLNKTADANNFIVVYPQGIGPLNTWNSGGFKGKLADGRVDDVDFVDKMLDYLEMAGKIDPHRIFACGMSNGGMMCYRLAAELSDRIAAIAPVAGTVAIAESHPKRPVSVIHFHGTADTLVPYLRRREDANPFVVFETPGESVATWVKLDRCRSKPTTEVISAPLDEMKVVRDTYTGGKEGAEVVLITVFGAGHTWPGQPMPVAALGKSDLKISANDLMWEFFKKHPMK